MITQPLTITELKEIFIREMLNATSDVTKISDQSVLSGVAFGVAKVAQKCMKDIAIIEQHLFPDEAYGDYLDSIAEMLGIAPRFAASGSSTFILLVADPGTIYIAGTHNFTGTHGITFQLAENYTMSSVGYAYRIVNSVQTGSASNVNSQSINQITTDLTGHQFCMNEYMAIGGAAAEDDYSLRQRIKEGMNLAASGTLAKLTQVFLRTNTNILRTVFNGITSTGKYKVSVVTQNGVELTAGELTALETAAAEYLNLTELRTYTNNVATFEVDNINWFELNMSFRIQLLSGYAIADVARSIQISISKYLDFRFWDNTKKIQWDDLLEIVKSTKGVDYVPDEYFTPRTDQSPLIYQFPRIKTFVVMDINGVVLATSNVDLPVYYPAIVNKSFNLTMLEG